MTQQFSYLVIYDIPYEGSKVARFETREHVRKYLKMISTYERSQSEIEIFPFSSVVDEATFLATNGEDEQ